MGTSWRNHILKEFTPKVSRLTLVADPDGLLLEEGVLADIRGRGFDLLPFEDHIAFRYAYESRFRSHWDRSEQTDLVVVLHSQAYDLGSLPFDLLQVGRQLSFSLGDIFPSLSYPIISALDRGDLDALYEAQKRHAPGHLGDNATKEFVLRHVFQIAPELIKQPSDLLRVFLRLHYQSQRIPSVLAERLIQLLQQSNNFNDWPLELLTTDRETFCAFLQERWPIFLNHMKTQEESVRESEKVYGLAIKGPTGIPFNHHDIRGYIENMFLEGMLQPVPHDYDGDLSKTWVSIGVRNLQPEDRFNRLSKLVKNLQTSIPEQRAKYTDWFHFSRGWAELILLSSEQDALAHGEIRQNLKNLQAEVDIGFATWISKRYAGLINLPPSPPVMLHHLPRFLARQLGEGSMTKVALLLVDGLSLDQWLVVRGALSVTEPDFLFREQAVFAWIPSITSVSRQATFAGKPPIFFPDSIHVTDKESILWMQFWADQGFTSNEVLYTKGLGAGSLENLSEELSHPKARVAGLVIDKIDKIMHGMELGTAGMHNQVRQWAQQPYMASLIHLLLERGFQVFLTSDHGNIETNGCGRPAEGVVADLRGERVRIYPDAVFRSKVKERFPDAHEWDPIGLPDDFLALVAPPRKAFVKENECTISHGGISIEELIVPLVQIERRGV